MKSRSIGFLTLVLAVTGVADAASITALGPTQIQIGSGGSGVVSTGSSSTTGVTSLNGLTSSYIGTTPATEGNYAVGLFASALPTPQPYYTYSTSTANHGAIVDSSADGGNGVTFSMIDDSTTGGNSNNYWSLTQPGNPTMTIPIGIFGVTDVWTLVNSFDAQTPTKRDENIVFNFSSVSATGPITSYIGLKPANSGNGSSPGQLMNSLSCPGSSPCSGLSNGPSAASASLTNQTFTNSANFPIAGTSVSGSTSVYTDVVYSASYTSASGDYAGTAGTVNLESEGFFFTGSALTTATSNYLVSIEINEAGTAAEVGASLGISAVTVDAVPEPSTAFLLLAGVGVFGLARLRKFC